MEDLPGRTNTEVQELITKGMSDYQWNGRENDTKAKDSLKQDFRDVRVSGSDQNLLKNTQELSFPYVEVFQSLAEIDVCMYVSLGEAHSPFSESFG